MFIYLCFQYVLVSLSLSVISQEMTHKVKLRSTKIKFLKKQVKELEKQKEKAEEVMVTIPDLQKRIDQLTREKSRLQEDIVNRQREVKVNFILCSSFISPHQ